MQETVGSYFDGELEALRAAEFERHVETCMDCSDSLERIRLLHIRLQSANLFERARPELYEAIQQQLPTVTVKQPSILFFFRPRFWVPALVALTTLAGLVCALLVFRPQISTDRVTAELIDAHIRSLMPGHLTDVESSDQHTVKPWFQGKLNFVPPVTDYVDQGFPLVGGRLDVIDGREIASVIYYRRKHIINVFVWPYKDKAVSFANSGTSQGYNWLIWRDGEMVFCAISDAAPSSLQQLKGLLTS
jgi:anti-sigma factor RsiW